MGKFFIISARIFPQVVCWGTTEKKMSNATNKRQLEILVSLMEKYPDIATGYSKRTKDEAQNIWKTIENELNSIGPPSKSAFEWKRVWSDKKKYIKKKMSENLKSKNSTGGGPSREYKFSDLEETIIKICAMSESVEGHCDSLRFGLPSCSKKRKLSSHFEEVKENTPQNEEEPNELDAVFRALIDTEDTPCNLSNNAVDNVVSDKTPPQSKQKSRQVTKNSLDFLEKETHLQEKLVEQIGEAVSLMKNHQNEIQASAKKIYRSIDRLYDQQKEVLKETMRHNIEMEKLRKYEIEQKLELKTKLLEIEVAKLEKY